MGRRSTRARAPRRRSESDCRPHEVPRAQPRSHGDTSTSGYALTEIGRGLPSSSRRSSAPPPLRSRHAAHTELRAADRLRLHVKQAHRGRRGSGGALGRRSSWQSTGLAIACTLLWCPCRERTTERKAKSMRRRPVHSAPPLAPDMPSCDDRAQTRSRSARTARTSSERLGPPERLPSQAAAQALRDPHGCFTSAKVGRARSPQQAAAVQTDSDQRRASAYARREKVDQTAVLCSTQ